MATLSLVTFSAALLVAINNAAPQNNKLSIKIPEGCNAEGFCSIRPEGYDEIEEKINSLLSPILSNLGDRSGRPFEPIIIERDDDNCPSEMTPERVYMYRLPNSTRVDILVNTALFPQTVEKITCMRNRIEKNKVGDAQCFTKLGMTDFQYKFTCHESTAVRKLLVYDPDNVAFDWKNYTIPVCCSCRIST